MAHYFFAIEHFESKFVELITKISNCNEFFTNRWLPNIFVHMIATNSRNKLKHVHLVLLVNKQPTFIILALLQTRLKSGAKHILLLCNEMPYLHSVSKTSSDLFTDFYDAKSTFSFTS